MTTATTVEQINNRKANQYRVVVFTVSHPHPPGFPNRSPSNTPLPPVERWAYGRFFRCYYHLSIDKRTRWITRPCERLVISAARTTSKLAPSTRIVLRPQTGVPRQPAPQRSFGSNKARQKVKSTIIMLHRDLSGTHPDKPENQAWARRLLT